MGSFMKSILFWIIAIRSILLFALFTFLLNWNGTLIINFI